MGSIFLQTLKEPIEYMVEYIVVKLLGTFWKHSQWVAQVCGGHILIKFTKETTGLFQRETDGFFDGFF